ncbi:MAG: hypothetical protein ABIR54_23835, partial [Burkholderiaceae bacterium]
WAVMVCHPKIPESKYELLGAGRHADLCQAIADSEERLQGAEQPFGYRCGMPAAGQEQPFATVCIRAVWNGPAIYLEPD